MQQNSPPLKRCSPLSRQYIFHCPLMGEHLCCLPLAEKHFILFHCSPDQNAFISRKELKSLRFFTHSGSDILPPDFISESMRRRRQVFLTS